MRRNLRNPVHSCAEAAHPIGGPSRGRPLFVSVKNHRAASAVRIGYFRNQERQTQTRSAEVINSGPRIEFVQRWRSYLRGLLELISRFLAIRLPAESAASTGSRMRCGWALVTGIATSVHKNRCAAIQLPESVAPNMCPFHASLNEHPEDLEDLDRIVLNDLLLRMPMNTSGPGLRKWLYLQLY